MKVSYSICGFEGKSVKELLRLFLISCFLFIILQLTSCASTRQTNVINPTLKNETGNIFQNINEQKQANIKNIDSENNVNSELEKNRRLWLENNINDYDFVTSFYVSGFNSYAEPVLIKVRDGKAASIEPISNSDERSIDIYTSFNTINKMFDSIEQKLEEGVKVEVKYDKRFHYPSEIYFDYSQKGYGAYNKMVIEKFEIMKIND